ncbi:MAG TPA: hypothetical protein VHK86_07035 [Nitrososphaera sp.]|jgi:hypothetical protein|nr:hypothetical protein [Nitrososphaera sp.]HEX2614085.1 hypothetical protein [Nitrososphaera sp.]
MSSKWFIGIIVALAIAVGIVVAVQPSSAPEEKHGSLASLRTTPAPWPVDNNNLRDRLLASNLPVNNVEGSATHIHQHIDIFIHGQHMDIPADIGLTQTITSPIHVHDTGGIIHVESPEVNAQYTLKQFFNVYGVQLTNSQLGSYKNDGANTLKVYSNGQLVKDPLSLKLTSHEEIAIVYGSDGEKPASIPKDYNFPEGL